MTIITDRDIEIGRYLIRIRSGRWNDGTLVTAVAAHEPGRHILASTDGPQTEPEALRKVLAMIVKREEEMQAVKAAILKALHDAEAKEGGEG